MSCSMSVTSQCSDRYQYHMLETRSWAISMPPAYTSPQMKFPSHETPSSMASEVQTWPLPKDSSYYPSTVCTIPAKTGCESRGNGCAYKQSALSTKIMARLRAPKTATVVLRAIQFQSRQRSRSAEKISYYQAARAEDILGDQPASAARVEIAHPVKEPPPAPQIPRKP
jgi:hypothetical protein